MVVGEEEADAAEGVARTTVRSRIEGSRLPRVFGERIRLSFGGSSGSWFEDTVAISLVPSDLYISQNQIGSKVHRQNSPSSSKEVHWEYNTYRTMQALVSPFILIGKEPRGNSISMSIGNPSLAKLYVIHHCAYFGFLTSVLFEEASLRVREPLFPFAIRESTCSCKFS